MWLAEEPSITTFKNLIPTFGVAGTIFLAAIYVIHKGWFRPQREILEQKAIYEEKISITKEITANEIKEIKDNHKLQMDLKDAIYSEFKIKYTEMLAEKSQRYNDMLKEKEAAYTLLTVEKDEFKLMMLEQFKISQQAVKTATVATTALTDKK